MKKTVLLLLLFCSTTNPCLSQEWMTSLEVAKSLARVQNKMLFVMWEGSTSYDFPVVYTDENGIGYTTDLFQDESINEAIWDYFVPVLLPEWAYDDLFKEIENRRSDKYINIFQNDGIKIMDVNGTILNTGNFNMDPFNIVEFIRRYRLKTSFIKAQLINYNKKKNFNTAFALGSKYLDFAILVDKTVRKEVTELSSVYLNESKILLKQDSTENKEKFIKRFELLDLKKDLILNRPRKVLRRLKKIDESSIDTMNNSLFAFLYYTSYALTKNEKKAELWKSKVSLVDLKKAEMIINNNL
ncbi:MAG: hypothetical protein HKO00_04880 [Flavobacteriaceae bacterium]|nr:hypothetical protein [Flavobacteriaceae bacterium]